MHATSPELADRLIRASRIIAWSTIFIGASTLLGWITGSVTLQTWGVGPITMKVITAAGLVLAGVALALLLPGERGLRTWIGQSVAVVVGTLGFLSVLLSAVDANLGIDRMAAVMAVGFLCLGGSLFGLRPGGWRWAPRALMAILTGLVGVMGIEDALLDPEITHIGMAGHTALAFFLLGFGVLFARPREGLMRLMITPGTSGTLARRLLPVGIVVPLLFTWLGKAGSHAGWYDSGVEASVMAAVRMVAHCTLMLWALRSAQQMETARELAEHGVRRANRSLDALSQANEAVVRAGDEQELLQSVCRTVVETGGYKLAWVGVPLEDENKTVRMVASAGQGDQDVATAAGLGSSIALPLLDEKETLGVLNIYSSKTDAFDTKEMELLSKLAANLAFGVAALRAGQKREQAEQALQWSEQRHRSLVQVTTQIVWATDPDGQVRQPIPGWQEFTGQTDAEVLGDGWSKAVHPEDVERARMAWATALATRTPYEAEYRIRRYDGAYRYFAARGVPVLGEDHSIREWIRTCSDITEQKDLETGLREAQAYNRGLIESSIDGLVTVNDAMVVTDVNETMCRMAGKAREEIVGSAFPGYFTEPARAEESVILTFRQGAVADYELTLQSAEGREIPVSFNAAVFRDASGQVRGIFAAARDITERQRVAAALSRNADELKRSNQELEDFATVAAHDLQEPLRKITVFGERLSQHCATAMDERGHDYLERMQDAARRMSGLINGLLEYSRVTRKGRDFERTDLNEVVAGVLADLESRIEEAHAEVLVETLPLVLADRLQMRQLFQNLFSNALKFRRPQEAHRLTVAVLRAGAGWEIRVGDNGIGFEERFLDRIFKPFQRLHARGDYEGHGMGLAVCDKIVRRHGWRIAAHSRLGQGSEFIVTIPVRLEHKEEPQWTASTKIENGGRSLSSSPKTTMTISR